MRWIRPKEWSALHPHSDYVTLLQERLKHPDIVKASVHYPTEGEVYLLWKDRIESGELPKHVWIVHYILAKHRFERLKVSTKRRRVYDEFTGVELSYRELHGYLYGPHATDEALQYFQMHERGS